MCAPAAGPAELPQLTGSSVVVVDCLVEGVGVDFAGAVAVECGRYVFDELGKSRLVVGGYAFTRGAAFGLRPHSETIPRSGPSWYTKFRCLGAAFGTQLAPSQHRHKRRMCVVAAMRRTGRATLIPRGIHVRSTCPPRPRES